MKVKFLFKAVAWRILFYRLRRKQFPQIKKLIRGLRKTGLYNKYPIDKYSPVIGKYKFYRKSDKQWLNFYYSVYGKADKNFISVPIYYFIETCLNNRMLTYGIKEKNFYNKFLKAIPGPATPLRFINGFYYDNDYNRINESEIISILLKYNKIIIKPSVESGGGSSVLVFEKSGNVLRSGTNVLSKEFLEKYRKDFVIQEFVVQHAFFSQFNENSNNTIRILTYRSVKDDTINILHELLRIGARGNFLDHDHLGGVVLSIRPDNKIGKYAIDRSGNKYAEVNNIKLESIGEVPSIDQIRILAKEIAGNIYYGRLLAIDFTVDYTGNPLLLEINCWRNGISQYQMHNGGLFKEFTEEILEYCQNLSPGYVIKI